MNPLELRRREDLRRVRALCDRSGGRYALLWVDAEAPSALRLRLALRTAIDDSYPRRRADAVDVAISIPAGYPLRSGPSARLAPVVFHPNVFPGGVVCQGSRWLVSEYLDLYVKRIARIVTFQDDVLNLASVANLAAAQWYRRLAASSPGTFPTDSVEALEVASRAAGLDWKDAG